MSKMPCFGARASLYKSGGRYRAATVWSDRTSDQVGLAQEDADCWYGHWCGPFCGSGDPIDDLDECCRAHDGCYDARGWGACSCDAELVACAFPKQFEFVWPFGNPGKAAAAATAVTLFTGKITSGACSELGGETGGGGSAPSRPHKCSGGQRCCEPAPGGLCYTCAPPGGQCP